MHDFSGMADAGGMGYPPSPLIGPWPRVFGCGAGDRNSYTTGNKSGQITFAINGVTYTPVAAGPWMRIATADGSGVDGVSVTRW